MTKKAPQKDWNQMDAQEKRQVKMVLFTVGGFILAWIITNFLTALCLVFVGWSVYFIVRIFTSSKGRRRFNNALAAAIFFIVGAFVAPQAPSGSDNSSVGGPSAQVKSVTENKPTDTPVEESKSKPEPVKQVCDGKKTTANCFIGDIEYEKYIYHAAVAEVSREEKVTTYKSEVASYCTLCRDGTYSPSCATGRGACSHHGGVAQWNAPRYREVPVAETRKVVEVEARDAYYEKVLAGAN